MVNLCARYKEEYSDELLFSILVYIRRYYFRVWFENCYYSFPYDQICKTYEDRLKTAHMFGAGSDADGKLIRE